MGSGGSSDSGSGGAPDAGSGGAPDAGSGGVPDAGSTGGVDEGGAAGNQSGGEAGSGASTGKVRVYIVSTTDRNSGLVELLGMADLSFASGRNVVIKPNFNSANPYPATTHNDTISGVASALKNAGAGHLTFAESSGTTETANAFATKGIPALCDAHGMTLVNYDDLGAEDFESFSFGGMRWPGGSVAIPRLVRSNNAVVLLPVLKTHVWGEMTLSMKLAVGLVPTQRRWDELHPSGRGSIELVPEISKGFTADLIVLDAIKGFKAGGPDEGTECSPGLLIAGNDRVAVDAVGLAVLKIQGAVKGGGIAGGGTPFGAIFSQGQIRRAVEIGVDQARSPEDIELVGNDEAVLAEIRAMLDQG